MNVTRMEDFFNQTRQQFSISECSIGKVDCRDKFEVIGTLNGQCLTYNPCGQKFSRDNEFRIIISGNNTGNRYCKLVKWYVRYSGPLFNTVLDGKIMLA